MSVMERPQMQSRPRSGFSLQSEKSQSSKASARQKEKEHHRAPSDDKRKFHLASLTAKANPNAAMNEAQPVAAALEDSTMGSLRAMRHTDVHGNPISEPDLSNPTRPRWERPLDTIRSFEAAIDGEYKRRTSMMRADTVNDGYASRRSSYYGGGDQPHSSRYSQVGGYYGSRNNYHDNSYGQPMPGPTSRNRFNQRLQSDPAMNRHANGHGLYPTPSHQQSRDTVNTGGSGSQSEPWGNSTDPSSEDSSIERPTPGPKYETGESYSYSGYGGPVQPHGRIPEERENSMSPNYRFSNTTAQNGGYFQPQHYGAPPAAPGPASAMSQSRAPNNVIKLSGGSQPLGASSGNAQPGKPLPRAPSEKRKSWFKRRFSKD